MKTFKKRNAKSFILIIALAANLASPAVLLAKKAKVDICHATGSGKGITLNVAPEGAYSGHIPNHPLDTVGACAVEDTGSSYNNNSSSDFDSPFLQIKEFRETQ